MKEMKQKTDHGHGGEIFALPEEEREKILDFSVNINPLGLSPRGRAAVLASFDREAGRYPDSECRALKAALSRRYGVPEGEITCGNGATELMYALVRAVRPSAVYVPAPSFSEYRFAAEASGVPVISFPLDRDRGFQLQDTDFLRKLPPHPLLFVGHPNNPDGQLLSRETFLSFLKAAEEAEGWLVVDESFIDFLGDSCSFRSYVSSHPRLVILLSLTKFYSVPGLRIGAAVSSPAHAAQLSRMLCPWNVNGPAQLYMREAVQDKAYIRDSQTYMKAERRRMDEALRALPGIHVYDGTVNFFLLRLTNGRDGTWLARCLAPFYLKIRLCGNYEGLDDTFIRVAVRTQEENDRLLCAWKEVFCK